MSLDTLRAALPAYAKDLSLNLSSLAAETVLSEQQKWGAFVASAHALGVPAVIQAIEASATEAGLSDEARNAARAAAAIMGMNNVYYRSLHLISNDEYKTLPARLRMNVLANPGVDKVDFELWSLVVSAVNGCGMCLEAHEKVCREAGLSAEQVQAAVRIAATVHAVARTLSAEEALAPQFAAAA